MNLWKLGINRKDMLRFVAASKLAAILKFNLPYLLILPVLSFGCAGVQSQEYEIDIDQLAYNFLESYNQLDGVELAGGPFQLADYDVEEEIHTFNNGQRILTKNYVFQEMDGFPVLIQRFQIEQSQGKISKFHNCYKKGQGFPKPAIHGDLKTTDLSWTDIPVIDFRSIHQDFSIVTIEDSQVIKDKYDMPMISKVDVINEDKIYLYYVDTYRSYYFEGLGTGRDFRFRFTNGQWETRVKNTFQIETKCRDNRFILYGNLPDKKLIELVNSFRQAFPGINILQIEVNDDTASIVEGDLSLVTNWLQSRIIAIAVLEKKDDWQIIETAGISFVDETYSAKADSIPFAPLPLHCEPDKVWLDAALRDIHVNYADIITNEKVEEVLKYIYRMRGVSKNVLAINWNDSANIDISVGNEVIQKFTFHYDGENWRICNYENIFSLCQPIRK